MSVRPALFISHASPEDNRFVLWLGAKLAALGYEVWADVLRLRGGDDWQRKLENALRERAAKVLFVANPVSAEKQGVRNEIQIATEVAKKIDDKEFVIPLRLAPYEAPFLIAHAQYVDFSQSWSAGLAELVKTLGGYGVARSADADPAMWRDLQLAHAKALTPEPETLISNWLELTTLPSTVRIYDFKAGISLGVAKTAMDACPWPIVPFRRGFISFAPFEDLSDHFGLDLPLDLIAETSTEMFIADGFAAQEIAFWDARRRFSDLVRRACEARFSAAGLASHAFANDRLAWWSPKTEDTAPRIRFAWTALTGQRQVQGFSAKRNIHWHYGISVQPRTAPIPHLRVLGRLVFTADGREPLDAARNQRLRRSFAKSWRNARWRDMMLAFLWRLVDGQEELRIPVTSTENLVARAPPLLFEAPVRVMEGQAIADEDDPSEDDDPETRDGAEELEGDDGDEP
ncbi:MAG: toll/interleukin-1 receptor domain-containing protein [Hyphomonadaceae bacterium]